MTKTALIRLGSLWNHSTNLFTGRIGRPFMNSSAVNYTGIFGERCPGWLRLMSAQQYGVLVPGDIYMKSKKRKQSKPYQFERVYEVIYQRFDSGRIKIPARVTVTSLPPKPKMNYQESVIALIIETCDGAPKSDLLSIVAVSNKEKLCQVCKPKTKLMDSVQLITGIQYDDKTNEVLYAGKPVETVEPKMALQNLLKFVKAHNNPLFVMFSGERKTLARLDFLLKVYGLYDEMISAVPYYVDALYVAKMKYPRNSIPNFYLSTLCKKINFDMPVGDLLNRADGLRRFFTRRLATKRFDIDDFVCSLNIIRTQKSYTELLLRGEIALSTVGKLAKQGVSLDHLLYLITKGEQEFYEFLKKRGINEQQREKLYVLLNLKYCKHDLF